MNFRNNVWQNQSSQSNTSSPMRGGNEQFNRSGNNNFFSPGSYSNSTPSLTPEQVAFEKEFTKWESSFAEWKNTYAEHPDQSAFREYEKKFLDIRDKLLVKRTRVYGSNNTHSVFEAHLNAASSMAEHLLNFDESPNRPNRFSNQMNSSGFSDQMNNQQQRFSNQQQNNQNRFSNQANNNRFNPYQGGNNDQRFKKQGGPGTIGNFLRSSSQTSNNKPDWKNKQNNQQQPKKKKTPGIQVQQGPA